MTTRIRTVGPETEVTDLLTAAEAAGRQVSLVRARAGKRATIEAFARVLHFPPWHGHTLDALSDCLTDWAERTAGEQEVVIDDARRLSDRDATGGITEVLTDLVREHPHVHVTLIDR